MKSTIQFVLLIPFLLIITKSEAQDVYKLWEGQNKPYYKENDLKEYEEVSWDVMCVFNVTEPTLTDYEADPYMIGEQYG